MGPRKLRDFWNSRLLKLLRISWTLGNLETHGTLTYKNFEDLMGPRKLQDFWNSRLLKILRISYILGNLELLDFQKFSTISWVLGNFEISGTLSFGNIENLVVPGTLKSPETLETPDPLDQQKFRKFHGFFTYIQFYYSLGPRAILIGSHFVRCQDPAPSNPILNIHT